MSTTLESIAEQESQNFLTGFTASDKDGFNNVDLSGIPNFNKPQTEEFAAADRHGFNNVVLSGTNKLKELAGNPDAETLQRIAEETGDAELAEKVKEDLEEREAIAFVNSHPTYYKDEDGDNYAALREYLDERKLPFTAANLDIAFKALCRAGEMKMQPGTPKVLSHTERLHVITLAQNGQLADAISQYLNYALPSAEEDWADETTFLSDPNTINVRNNAVRFVWFHSRAGVQDSDEFRGFEKKFFRNRPLRTIELMDTCYEAFQQEYKSALRNKLLSPNEPNTSAPAGRQQSLDDLDDESFDRLYHGTLREFARNAKRQPGVLV